DICGCCISCHRTLTCNAGDAELWCSECNETGHRAAQIDRKNKLKQKRNLEVKYKFYVTEEHWT
ncbi:hypothetical protein K435DRAFT_693762, partial [Dendrothele bispora CBS 962.96]